MSLLSVFISVPFVGALILLALNDSNTGRVARIAAMFSGAAFLISLLALLPDTRLLAANSAPAGAAQLLFRTAALSAPAFTASQLACLGCLCAPLPFGAAARPNRYYALLLAAQAALGAIFCTTNWLILLSLWAASALACYFLLRETRAASSIFGWLHLLFVLMLALGLAGIKFYGSWWPMALLLCAAAIRMGTFPFQGWLKPSASTTDGPQTALLAGPFMSSGIYLFCAIGTSAQAAPELHRAVPGALLLALCYSPLAALAQLSVLSSIGFISAALCAFFALTASVLGTQAAISAALLGTAAQGLAASLSALSYSRRQTAKPLFTPLALAGAPATILFAAFFVAVSLLFRKNIYLAGAALLALLLSAAAAHALNDKNSPYTGEKPAGALAELSLKLIALAIIAGGLFPFLQGAHPPF